jgi:cell division protein FtsA
LQKKIDESGLRDLLGTGVVLTGGMTKIKGIREVALEIFKNLPVRIATPDNKLVGLVEDLDNPIYSTAVGLILYSSGEHTKYEIDSNNKLRYQNELELKPAIDITDLRDFGNEPKINRNEESQNTEETNIRLPQKDSNNNNGKKQSKSYIDFIKNLF